MTSSATDVSFVKLICCDKFAVIASKDLIMLIICTSMCACIMCWSVCVICVHVCVGEGIIALSKNYYGGQLNRFAWNMPGS